MIAAEIALLAIRDLPTTLHTKSALGEEPNLVTTPRR
jgi:hypothetical protein